jgi:uncharacterized protein DUF3786
VEQPRCPGQDMRFWKPEDIYDVPCPWCQEEIEFWKDEPVRTCPSCKQAVPNPRIDQGCAEWCLQAKECLSAMADGVTPEGASANHLAAATQEAIRRARDHLKGVDLHRAASLGGLPAGEEDCVEIQVLGRLHFVQSGSFKVKIADGEEVHPVDELLILRYLAVERKVEPLGEQISFRDLPGGSAYLAPTAGRTTNLLLKVFGNDLDRLRKALSRYPTEELKAGDLGVVIHAIGRLDVTLVYRAGDEEFPASADLVYDRIIASVYHTDEVAALATRLCTGLLKGPSMKP